MTDRIVEFVPRVDAQGNLIGGIVALRFDSGQGEVALVAHQHPSRAPFEIGKASSGETLPGFLTAIGYDPATKRVKKSDFVAFERAHFAAEKAKWLQTLAPRIRPVKVALDSSP